MRCCGNQTQPTLEWGGRGGGPNMNVVKIRLEADYWSVTGALANEPSTSLLAAE